MRRETVARVSTAVVVLLVLGALVVWFVYRPWAVNWGSTDEEIARPMPGDEVLEKPTFNATRAVTIEATPEEIWPWIVQIGYRRAGFYSYDTLDNDGIPSAERILPEFQTLQVGDTIPLSASAHARVTEFEPPTSMVLVFEVSGPWSNATWVWGLYPEDASRTRLVTRLRAKPDRIPPRVLLDLAEIIMMRKHMLGIKRRAEQGDRSEPQGRGISAPTRPRAHAWIPPAKLMRKIKVPGPTILTVSVLALVQREAPSGGWGKSLKRLGLAPIPIPKMTMRGATPFDQKRISSRRHLQHSGKAPRVRRPLRIEVLLTVTRLL